MGSLFTGMAEAGEQTGHRWRTMLWTTMWLFLATLLGGFLTDVFWLGLIATTLVAAGSGLAGSASPRAGLIALFALVNFTVYFGGPDTAMSPWLSASLIAVGGLSQALVMIGPYLITDPRIFIREFKRRPPFIPRVREHLRWHDQYVDHAIRLSIAVTIATAIAHASGLQHQYWLPMTVAWVTQSGQLGTVQRVLSRILGTFAGLIVVIAYIDWVHAQGQWLVPLTAIAGGLAVLFITSNYLISVIGTTTLIVTVLYMDGDKLSSTAPLRLGETIVAGIIAIAALTIWPDSKILPEAASVPRQA
jgi:MFS family permease